MYVILVGAKHKTAPVEMREKLSFARGRSAPGQVKDIFTLRLSGIYLDSPVSKR